MKKLFAVAVAMLALVSANRNVEADILVIDISGVEFIELEDDPLNTNIMAMLGQGPSGAFKRVIGIGWDYTFSTVGASWGSEAVIRFGGNGTAAAPAPIYLTADGTNAPVTNQNVSSGGIVDLIGLGLDFWALGPALELHFFDTFQDNPGSADAVISSGTITIEFIPEPSAFALLGLGFIGLVARRRR